MADVNGRYVTSQVIPLQQCFRYVAGNMDSCTWTCHVDLDVCICVSFRAGCAGDIVVLQQLPPIAGTPACFYTYGTPTGLFVLGCLSDAAMELHVATLFAFTVAPSRFY